MDGTVLCLIDHHLSVKFKEYIAIGSKFSHNYFNILKNPFIDLNKNIVHLNSCYLLFKIHLITCFCDVISIGGLSAVKNEIKGIVQYFIFHRHKHYYALHASDGRNMPT